jgi:predicted Fe-Mo cluster-binding NifX family protein
MKAAVCYENGNVFQHFGHTEQFKLYTIENKKIISTEIISTGGTGHEALADFLKDRGVSAIICGGIGGGAVTALTASGLTIYAGNSGAADEKAQLLAEGKLAVNANANCNHHEEHDGHKDGPKAGSLADDSGLVFHRIG